MVPDPATTLSALPRPARRRAGETALRLFRFAAVALPVRLLRAAFLPGGPDPADFSDHQLADIGLQRSDLRRMGWGGARECQAVADTRRS